MRARKSIFILCLAGVLLAWGVGSVWAASKERAALFPQVEQLKKHQFAQPPVNIEVRQPLLEESWFNIPIPSADWQKIAKIDPKPKDGRLLAGFTHPLGPKQGNIQVWEYKPTFEVNPKDWLISVMVANGLKTIALGGEGIMPGPLAEVLVVTPMEKGAKGQPLMIRAAVYRTGKRFILVRCAADANKFVDLAYYFGTTTTLFKLINPKPEAPVGKWTARCLGKVCYTAPDVPMKQSKNPGPQKIHSFALTHGKTSTGSINVVHIAPPEGGKLTPQARIKGMIDLLAKKAKMKFPADVMGLKVAGHVHLPGDVVFARAKGQDAKGNAIEFFTLSQEFKGRALMVWMVTVSQERNYTAWMINKRTFEVVCQSLSY